MASGVPHVQEYIRSRIRPDGSIEPPYHLMQRFWALTKARAVLRLDVLVPRV